MVAALQIDKPLPVSSANRSAIDVAPGLAPIDVKDLADTRTGEAHPVSENAAAARPKLDVRNLTVHYGARTALENVSLDIKTNEIFGIIGPANSGKTSFLRVLNRMDVFTPSMRFSGEVRYDGKDLRTWRNLYSLRRRIGVVFPLPVGLPLSVYDNVAMAPRLYGNYSRSELRDFVERCLRRAALWDEVKDRLNALGSMLSGGQQQRLTIARALSQNPDLLLLDEFSIAVDPVTTMKIEDVLRELRTEMTVVMVTNLTQQARRLADRTAFFLKGECVEVGKTRELFDGKTRDGRTLDYLEGRFG
jgi:phosphate transport system ATP-binding protein